MSGLRETVARAIADTEIMRHPVLFAPVYLSIEQAEKVADAALAALPSVTEAQAVAWDEGCAAGGSRVRRQWSDEPGLPDATNPYRGSAS